MEVVRPQIELVIVTSLRERQVTRGVQEDCDQQQQQGLQRRPGRVIPQVPQGEATDHVHYKKKDQPNGMHPVEAQAVPPLDHPGNAFDQDRYGQACDDRVESQDEVENAHCYPLLGWYRGRRCGRQRRRRRIACNLLEGRESTTVLQRKCDLLRSLYIAAINASLSYSCLRTTPSPLAS